MPSIEQLLESLGVEDSVQEKTASTKSSSCSEKEIEKAAEELGLISNTEKDPTTKVASQANEGEHMNLHDLYDTYFGEEEVKTASDNTDVNNTDADGIDKEAAANLEAAGEQAGVIFANNLQDRLMKLAMEQAMESAATEARDGSSATAVPGATAASPQLPQNKPADAKDGKKMDLTPDANIMSNGPLLDKAIAKATILKALATNKTDGVEGVSQVDVGLETPASQKDA